MALPPHGGTLGLKGAAHLLRRATFGATKDQIDQFAGLTATDAINILFPNAPVPQPAPPLDPLTGQSWVLTGINNASSKHFELEDFFRSWFIGQMMANGITNSNQAVAHAAREKIVFFLHTHFTTIVSKVSNSRSLYFQNQLYREFALDVQAGDPEINFKALTVKVSVDNAMIRLLDGDSNVKGNVNENYARELLELYSIGRGLDGQVPPTSEQGDYFYYTEDDVKAAAQVLSGWAVAMPDATPFDPLAPDLNEFGFDTELLLPRGKVKGNATNASQHNNDVKTFSPRFGSATVTPDTTLLNGTLPTEESALDEITQLIDIIYAQPETARNICRKLYRFFVWAPHTTDEVNAVEPIITQLVSTFSNSGFRIQAVIEDIFQSAHFYQVVNNTTDGNLGSMIKSPIDLTLGTLRFFGVSLPNMYTDSANFYKAASYIQDTIRKQGLNYFEPYDVAGYEAYHQFPIYHRYWITPNTLGNRYDFIARFTGIVVDPGFDFNTVDVVQFIRTNFAGNAPNMRPLLLELADYLLPVTESLDFDDPDTTSSLTAKRMNHFKERFKSGFEEDYWTLRWNANDYDTTHGMLTALFNAMLQSPEYQLA